MRRQRALSTVALLLAAALLAGGYAYRQHHRFKHLAIHEEGRIYRSGWLAADDLREVVERHEVRTVINLTYPGEMGSAREQAERDAVRAAGARLLELEMPTDGGPEHPLVAQHMALLRDPENFPMLVHCQHGVVRTARLLAMYDIAFRGMSAETSLASMPLFGREAHDHLVTDFAHAFEREHAELFPELAGGAAARN